MLFSKLFTLTIIFAWLRMLVVSITISYMPTKKISGKCKMPSCLIDFPLYKLRNQTGALFDFLDQTRKLEYTRTVSWD